MPREAPLPADNKCPVRKVGPTEYQKEKRSHKDAVVPGSQTSRKRPAQKLQRSIPEAVWGKN